MDGVTAVALVIRKQSGTNTVEVAHKVHQELKKITAAHRAPGGAPLGADRQRPVHRALDRGREVRPVVRGAAGGGGHPVLPARLPGDVDQRPGDSHLRDRHLRLHPGDGLHLQQHDHAGAVAVDRHPGRRRHRGHREHPPPPGDGQTAAAGGVGCHRGDRPGGARDHLLHHRRVRAGRVHEGHHRPLLLPVRPDRQLRRGGVDAGVVHPDAHDGQPHPRAAPTTTGRTCSSAASERFLGKIDDGYRRAAGHGPAPPVRSPSGRRSRRWCLRSS